MTDDDLYARGCATLLAVYSNALLDRDLNARDRGRALDAMQAAYADAAVDRFAAWVHESDHEMQLTDATLGALADRGDGTWAVIVTVGKKASTVVADRVVLALPFSLLRQVDLSKANFPAQKLRAITQLPMGTNSKLHLQFSRRMWYDLSCNGATYGDTGYQNTWEVSRGQAGASGILVDYTGGTIGNGFGPSKTPSQYAQTFLGQLEPVLPGVTPLWNGRASLDYWTGYPWTRGSYSYWAVGQYTTIAGSEREAVGSCHFAGEHTSVDFQGYLNGAVQSGQRAAGEVIAALGR
jgi:monoamine oxidase